MPMIQSLEKRSLSKNLTASSKLIARHETLSTSFIQVGDEPFQKIHDHAFGSEYYDL
jgi:hypothetical protein